MASAQNLRTQGHFICDCDWHRHTHVGNICISTVGDYRERDYKGESQGEIKWVGYQRYYETLVQKFRWTGKCDECGKKHHRQGKGLRMIGYQTKKEAIEGHRKLVAEYTERAEKHAKLHGVR